MESLWNVKRAQHHDDNFVMVIPTVMVYVS